MSSRPPSTMTSASPIFWQVMPFAPAATCSLARSVLLWVLICGRLARPATSHAAWMRAMLRSTRSMSTTTAGVPNSREIRSASAVVMPSLSRTAWAGQAQAAASRSFRGPRDLLRAVAHQVHQFGNARQFIEAAADFGDLAGTCCADDRLGKCRELVPQRDALQRQVGHRDADVVRLPDDAAIFQMHDDLA